MKENKNGNTVTVRPLQSNIYEELPMGNNATEFNSIEEIEAYEAEQRRLFQQAVNEFRNANTEQTTQNNFNKGENNILITEGREEIAPVVILSLILGEKEFLL
jgi:hypothetical protein